MAFEEAWDHLRKQVSNEHLFGKDVLHELVGDEVVAIYLSLTPSEDVKRAGQFLLISPPVFWHVQLTEKPEVEGRGSGASGIRTVEYDVSGTTVPLIAVDRVDFALQGVRRIEDDSAFRPGSGSVTFQLSRPYGPFQKTIILPLHEDDETLYRSQHLTAAWSFGQRLIACLSEAS